MGRLLSFLFMILIIFVASRALVRALPGDPLQTLIEETGTRLDVDQLRHELNLDRPFFPALADDALRMLRGDWGHSLITGKPVGPLLMARFARTLLLTLLAFALTLPASVTLGLLAASRRGRRGRLADWICTQYGALAAALPIAWLGPILILVFSVLIPIVPPANHPLLPALTLSIGLVGLWSRLIRERVRESLAAGPARAARARGLAEWKILIKYGLAPVSGPLAAYLGTQAGGLLAGAFVVEVIFDWPGLGSLFVNSVLARDYPLVEGAALVSALFAVGGTVAGDLARARLDPRPERRAHGL